MTKQQVIDIFKTKLSESYMIRTTQYDNGKAIEVKDTLHPMTILSFDREVIETAVKLLEDEDEV